eukprot:scaffold22742_cov139-Cylindrotheca_fusiformis.AAC.6
MMGKQCSKNSSDSVEAKRRRKAIALNNKAKSEFDLGNYDQSIRLISTALRCLKDDIINRSSSIGDAYESCSSCDTLDRHLAVLLCNKGACHQLKDGQYLFTQVLTIPQSVASSKQSNALVSKVLMFNLGLCHHIMASKTRGKEAHKCLEKACRLYRLCHQVPTLERLAQQHFLPAILNNMGMAHLKMQETERATRFFQNLMTMVMHANVTGSSAYRSNNNIDCYLSNACNAEPKQCCTAVAA